MKNKQNKNKNQKELTKVKNGGISKHKQPPKFKNTPTGKVPLVVKSPNQKAVKKDLNSSKNSSPNKSKSLKKKQHNLSKEESSEDEEILSDVSFSDADVDDSDASDTDVPNIFGTSLNDDSDDSDEDFEEDEESEDDVAPEKKGIKMFKGINSSNDTDNSLMKTDDDDDDDEEEDDDEDDEEEDDDDDSSDGENEDSQINSSVVSSSKDDSDEDDDDDDDEEDEDDDDDDDDEDDDEKNKSLGLEALIGDSLVDDTSDEDFMTNGDSEEDDDSDDNEDDEENNISSPEMNKKKKKKMEKSDSESPESKKALEDEKFERTLFVGNVPKEVKSKQIEKLFSKYGKIENLRVRNIVPENPAMSYKVAAIKNKIHPKVKNVCYYITFASKDSLDKAVEMNGKIFEGRHLRVDHASSEAKNCDPKKAIFIGNLSFEVDEEELWKNFEHCGEIESVRVSRNRRSGVGKGIGYINFKTTDAVMLAMELDGTSLHGRDIRVKKYSSNASPSKSSPIRKGKRPAPSESPVSPKKFKRNKKNKQRNENSGEQKKKPKKMSQGMKKRAKMNESDSSPEKKQSKKEFQGQKADSKKKSKGFNKMEKKKKVMAEKLMAKTKKHVSD